MVAIAIAKQHKYKTVNKTNAKNLTPPLKKPNKPAMTLNQ